MGKIWDEVGNWADLAVGDSFMEYDSMCGRIHGKVLTKPVRNGDEETFDAAMEDGRVVQYMRNVKYRHYAPKVYQLIEF